MFQVVLLFFLLGAMATLRAEIPPALEAAVQKLIADIDRWAYTQEVREFDKNGKAVPGPTLERYDPSKPEDEQWTLRLYRGQIPTASDVRSWKRQKSREARRRERPLGEIIDFDRAVLSEEGEGAWVYRVPIKPGASRRLPEDKFYVLMRVDQIRHELTRVTVRTTESFRLSGVAGLAAKVDQVEIDAHFAVIDEQYAAQPAQISAAGSGRIAWVFRVGGRAEVAWTEMVRVKPYRDRFDVQIGDVKALDF